MESFGNAPTWFPPAYHRSEVLILRHERPAMAVRSSKDGCGCYRAVVAEFCSQDCAAKWVNQSTFTAGGAGKWPTLHGALGVMGGVGYHFAILLRRRWRCCALYVVVSQGTQAGPITLPTANLLVVTAL